jgi:actin related protein 2/3 complex subunit 5
MNALGKKLMPSQIKDVHLVTVTEILQSIKQADMTPMLTRIYGSEGGSEALDTLMKYM